MKFVAQRSKILESLLNILNVLPTRSTLPILSNILLETTEGKETKGSGSQLKIAATDLDMSMMSYLPVAVSKKGSITIPGKTFVDIIREAPEGEIAFTATDNRLEIKLENGSYKIGGIPAAEFPKLPEVNTARQNKVSSQDLVRMVRKTVFAISGDETRPALNGALWKAEDESMLMVATDGHRLAKVSMKNKKFHGLSGSVIVPPKALNLLVKLIGDEDKEVGVIFGDNHLIFNLEDSVISSRLIEGPYPNYEAVIPKDNDKKLIVEKELLASTTRRVSILSNNFTHQIKFAVKKDKMELSAANSDLGGEARETIPCDYDGDEMELGYNANYVLDILKQMEGDKVIFSLNTPVSAGMIFPREKKENEEYFCLIMPLRLAD